MEMLHLVTKVGSILYGLQITENDVNQSSLPLKVSDTDLRGFFSVGYRKLLNVGGETVSRSQSSKIANVDMTTYFVSDFFDAIYSKGTPEYFDVLFADESHVWKQDAVGKLARLLAPKLISKKTVFRLLGGSGNFDSKTLLLWCDDPSLCLSSKRSSKLAQAFYHYSQGNEVECRKDLADAIRRIIVAKSILTSADSERDTARIAERLSSISRYIDVSMFRHRYASTTGDAFMQTAMVGDEQETLKGIRTGNVSIKDAIIWRNQLADEIYGKWGDYNEFVAHAKDEFSINRLKGSADNFFIDEIKFKVAELRGC